MSQAGYQRVPVYSGGDPTQLSGILVVKNMIVLSPDDAVPLVAAPRAPRLRRRSRTSLESGSDIPD